jgi:DNA-binding NarL/FixJ family response regulator
MARKVQLSEYQLRILNLLKDGKGRSAISRELGISESTVRTRIDEIKDKFRMERGTDVDDLVDAAREAGVI